MSRLPVLSIAAALASACAQPLQPFGRVPGGGVAPCAFWPPPPATSTWTGADEMGDRSFGDVASRLAKVLHDAGYVDAQWYPIGARYDHGFAVTTRLERIDEDGAPRAASERWSDLVYPEPVSLRWLEGARTLRLPGPGHFRARS